MVQIQKHTLFCNLFCLQGTVLYWSIVASTNKSQMFVTFIKVYSVITVCHNSASSILQHNDDCFSLALLRSYGHILYSRWKVSVRREWLWTVCKSAKSFPSFLKLMINRWWWVRYTTQGVKLGIDLTMSIKREVVVVETRDTHKYEASAALCTYEVTQCNTWWQYLHDLSRNSPIQMSNWINHTLNRCLIIKRFLIGCTCVQV